MEGNQKRVSWVRWLSLEGEGSRGYPRLSCHPDKRERLEGGTSNRKESASVRGRMGAWMARGLGVNSRQLSAVPRNIDHPWYGVADAWALSADFRS